MWVCLISQDENGVMDLGERNHTGGVHGMISPHILLVMFTCIPSVDAVDWVSLL